MNIGERKRTLEKYVPEFEKHCSIDNINCEQCMNYNKDKKWCNMYLDELYDYLKEGKILRE